MDEMKIVSKFARGIVSKILKKVISKKSGYDVDIQLNAITVTISEGTGHLHLDMDAEMEKDELVKLLKSIGLD
jgi:hypothetical protein